MAMDLIDTGTDPWIVEYDACEKVAREIMENLNLRDSEKKSSQAYNALSAKIRIRLKQYTSEVSNLKKKLGQASIINTLTPEERERRQRQIEALIGKEVQMTEKFNQDQKSKEHNSGYMQSRAQLMNGKSRSSMFGDGGTTSWGDIGGTNDEVEDVRTFDEMKEEQERLLKEQDAGLENLLKIVTAQTKIATTINNEVEHHNEMLVDIADGMERMDGRINRAHEMVKVIEKKESIWGYWLVALLLFIAILGVTFA